MKYKYLHEQENFNERTQYWAREIEKHGVGWASQLLAMVEEDIFEAHHKITKKVEKKPHKLDKYKKAFSILRALDREVDTKGPIFQEEPVFNQKGENQENIGAKPVYTSPQVKIAKGEARPRKKCSGCKTYCNPCKKELKRRKSL